MNAHYPRTRVYADHGPLLMREGISICFYMRRNHQEVTRAVQRSLESFTRAVRPRLLGWYTNEEGELQRLDEQGWKHIQNRLDHPGGASVRLYESDDAVTDYGFHYSGGIMEEGLNDVCSACFWLPTEYLEVHGPGHVRELALELAGPLPFNSGHAGLFFNIFSRPRNLRELCVRHPGIDLLEQGLLSMDLGTQVRGAYWMTFLGQPVLGELGGAEGLRARLSSPDITLQELEAERVAITLGTWPEAGDTEAGQDLPLHRELARVLEPWLFHQQPIFDLDFPAEDVRCWERRFLD